MGIAKESDRHGSENQKEWNELLNAGRAIVLAIRAEESATERAAHAIHGAVADFINAIMDAKTPAEAWRLHAMLVPLSSVLESTERKARLKAEELNK